MWKWILRFSALPKRWIRVTAPVRAVCLAMACFFDQVRRNHQVNDAQYMTHDPGPAGKQRKAKR